MIERKKYPISVLIVDDEPVIVEQLAQILRRRVEVLHTASNGQEALNCFLGEKIDAIISDIDMPLMNGIELLAEIRRHNKDIPFILSTGLKSLDILIEAIEHNITSFLPKPLQIQELLAKIDQIARTKEIELSAQQSADLLNQYKSIVDATVIVSKADPNGIITYVNDIFCAVSGYAREELIGKPHSIVRDPDMPPAVFREMWETIRSRQIWHGIIHNRTKEGKQYTVKTTISPIVDSDGTIVEYIGLREDITDLIEKDERLRSERKKLDDILNHVDSIVAMVSVKEKLMFVNHKFFDIFPYRDFADYKSQYDCICDIFQPKEGYLQQMMGEEYWVEYVLARLELSHHAMMIDRWGNERIFDVKINRLGTGEGEFFVVTLSDVTELQHAKDEAKTAARMKGEFLANMSHEIRTPMNGILGFAALLERTEMNEQQKRFLGIINNSTRTLLGIINDILDFSKLESGKFELDVTPINPFVEFSKIAQLFSTQMSEKRITFDERVDPRLCECISIDLLRIQQIVSNLLSNAIKFTPEEGRIGFYVRLIQNAPEEIEIRIGVKDSGIGIPALHQAKIFEAFSQADSSTTRQFGGTGLGLSISSHLVALMGGALQLESKEGVGSDFYFDLRVKRCSAGHPLASFFQRRSISIIEGDDPFSQQPRQQVMEYLDQLKVSYRVFTKGESYASVKEDDICIVFCNAHSEWIDSLCERNITTLMVCNHPKACYSAPNIHLIENLEHNYSALYNALLSTAQEADLKSARLSGSGEKKHYSARVLVAEDNGVNQMLIDEYLQQYAIRPRIVENGKEALEALDTYRYDLILMDVNMPLMSGTEALQVMKERKITVPVIALTANAMAGDREKFLQQGYDGYLSKPIVVSEIEKVLETYLGDRKTMEQPIRTPEPQKSAASLTSLLNLDLIRQELPISDTVIYRLLSAFSASIDTTLPELKEAIGQHDYEKIKNSAHYLKGGSGNLRLKAIEVLAGRIETAAAGSDGAFDYQGEFAQIEVMMVVLKQEIEDVVSVKA